MPLQVANRGSETKSGPADVCPGKECMYSSLEVSGVLFRRELKTVRFALRAYFNSSPQPDQRIVRQINGS